MSVAQLKAQCRVIARQAAAGQEAIITARGKSAYRQLPIFNARLHTPFSDNTILAKKVQAFGFTYKVGGKKLTSLNLLPTDTHEANV